MSDDLSPEEHAVRRLLAQARHDEPVPADVAARLDGRLAALRAEREQDATSTRQPVPPVDDLAAARARRRRVPALLAAAAALVVGGVALSSVLGGTGSGSDSMSASDAGSGESADEEASTYATSPEAGADNDADADSEAQDSRKESGAAPQASLAATELTTGASLRGDVRRLARAALADRSEALRTGPAWPECALTPLPDGLVTWVLVDERPGAVVVLDGAGGRQPVEVWVCEATSALRTFTFPLD